MKKLLFCFLGLVGLIACAEEASEKKEDIWSGTQSIELIGEKIKLKIPTSFKRSSRYRVKEDIPQISTDSFRLSMLQNTLRNLEFQDSEIDLFVDTTVNYRLLLIMNVERINFDKTAGSIFNVKLKQEYETLERENIGLEAEKIDSRMKTNNRQKVLKYKYRIRNVYTDQDIYRTIFFISTKIQSFIVYEISSEIEDVEKYLWSIKD